MRFFERVIFGCLHRLQTLDPRKAIGLWHLCCLLKIKKNSFLRLVTNWRFLSLKGNTRQFVLKIVPLFLLEL
jgi:hypothetical protein